VKAFGLFRALVIYHGANICVQVDALDMALLEMCLESGFGEQCIKAEVTAFARLYVKD